MPQPSFKDFARHISATAAQRKISQTHLGLVVGRNRTSVSRYLSGVIEPLPDDLQAMAREVGIDEATINKALEPFIDPSTPRFRQYDHAPFDAVLASIETNRLSLWKTAEIAGIDPRLMHRVLCSGCEAPASLVSSLLQAIAAQAQGDKASARQAKQRTAEERLIASITRAFREAVAEAIAD